MNKAIDYPAEYDNSARVEGSDVLVDNYIKDAATYREHRAKFAQLDQAYGHGERNKLDIFWPDENRDCPVVMFIHGGYWQRLDRSAFSHMARGLNKKGMAVAIPSYTLCPDTTIAGIINEMRRACIMLHQTFKQKLVVAGHSAGGHLAACMMATDWSTIHDDLPHDLVTSGVGISGIYDLQPLLHTPVNDALKLNRETANASSPVNWLPDALQQFDAWVGGDESGEYHRQSTELAERWSMLGTPTRYVSLGDTNHFTVVHAMADPASGLVERIIELVKKPVARPELQRLDKKLVEAEMQELGDPRFRPEPQAEIPLKPEVKPGKKSKDKPQKNAKADKGKAAPSKKKKAADKV